MFSGAPGELAGVKKLGSFLTIRISAFFLIQAAGTAVVGVES
jgi:hypothetical protein